MTEENEQENERYGEINGMRAFSLADLAEKIGVSKGYISRRVGEEKDVRGYPVFEWAVRDGAGRVDHYRVPADAFEENDDDPDARENAAAADSQDGETVTAKGSVQSIRDVARAGRERRENEQAERHKEQLEADRKRRERAEQRRNARAKERDAQSDTNAHTYSVAEMAQILDTDAQKVHDAVANGRDVRGFPVNDFAVTDETGGLAGFRVPNSAFDDAESSRETGEARENADVEEDQRENASAAADQPDDQEEEEESEEEQERQRQPMPNGKGKGAPSLLSSFAALGGAVTLLGLFGSSDKR